MDSANFEFTHAEGGITAPAGFLAAGFLGPSPARAAVGIGAGAVGVADFAAGRCRSQSL